MIIQFIQYHVCLWILVKNTYMCVYGCAELLQLMENGVVGLTGVLHMDTNKPEAEVVTTLVQVVEEDNVMVTAHRPELYIVSYYYNF